MSVIYSEIEVCLENAAHCGDPNCEMCKRAGKPLPPRSRPCQEENE